MNCLSNLNKNRMPNDIIRRYLTLYRFIGRNREYIKSVENDYETLLEQTIQHDAYFMAQLTDLSISDARYKAILLKEGKPKNKDEILLKNFKHALKRMHADTGDFTLIDREIQDLLKFLYGAIDSPANLHFAKSSKDVPKPSLLASGVKTKRDALEALVNAHNKALRTSDYEPGFIALNFYVDFMQLKPFAAHNDVIALLTFYVLLLNADYQAFHLTSFFEKIFKRRETFSSLLSEASHNWAEGLSDTHDFHRFILDVTIESYKELSEMLRNYTFDQQLNKGDYIENTINKLDEVFTKEAIRRAHPTISESTINRTLKRLREEKKIRPLGRGRSAKWMKLYAQPRKKTLQEQMNLKL